MKQESVTLLNQQNSFAPAKGIDVDPFSVSWTKWHTGAAGGLTGSILTMIVGLALVLTAWIDGTSVNNSTLGEIGSWLMAAMFPLLMFGGYCLDKVVEVGKAQKAARRKYKLSKLPQI